MFDARTHFYSSFELRFDEGIAGWPVALGHTKSWLTKKLGYRLAESELSESWFLEGLDKPKVFGHHILDVATLNDADGSLKTWCLSYQHDQKSWTYRKWKTEITISSNGTTLVFTVRLSHFVAGDWVGIEPKLPTPSIPGVVSQFIADGTAYSGGVQLRETPILISASQALHFKNFLHSPERVLPVALISKTLDGKMQVDAKVLAKQLKSIAHVYIVEDEAADVALAQALPQEFRTFAGALRLYLPQVNTIRPADAFRHRYFRFGETLPVGGTVDLLILRAALRHSVLQHDRNLVSVGDLRVRKMLDEARSQADESVLLPLLEERVAELERTNDAMYLEYGVMVQRLEASEGQTRDLADEIRHKDFQLASLRNQFQKKEEDLAVALTEDEKLHSALKAKVSELPIICVRSKQDSSYLPVLCEVFNVLEDDLTGFFIEDVREHSSNLVSSLRSAYKNSIVLYTHGHLKYMNSDDKKVFQEFFGAEKVRDTVSRFDEWLQG